MEALMLGALSLLFLALNILCSLDIFYYPRAIAILVGAFSCNSVRFSVADTAHAKASFIDKCWAHMH